jgi:hypothetical protein
MAMFGTLAAVTALIPVANSGREVTAASITNPTQDRDIPVFSPIASARRVSFDPA